MQTQKVNVKHQPPTAEQIRKMQIAEAERDAAKVKANLPAPTNGGTALADHRTDVQRC